MIATHYFPLSLPISSLLCGAQSALGASGSASLGFDKLYEFFDKVIERRYVWAAQSVSLQLSPDFERW